MRGKIKTQQIAIHRMCGIIYVTHGPAGQAVCGVSFISSMRQVILMMARSVIVRDDAWFGLDIEHVSETMLQL